MSPSKSRPHETSAKPSGYVFRVNSRLLNMILFLHSSCLTSEKTLQTDGKGFQPRIRPFIFIQVAIYSSQKHIDLNVFFSLHMSSTIIDSILATRLPFHYNKQ